MFNVHMIQCDKIDFAMEATDFSTTLFWEFPLDLPNINNMQYVSLDMQKGRRKNDIDH